MKFIWIFLTTLISISCSTNENKSSNEFVKREFKLIDLKSEKPFALIKLLVPVKYDTFLMWTNMSDCTCCHLRMYRFTNSKGCLLRETGFLPSASCQDSVDMLTLSHQCKNGKYEDINMRELSERIKDSDIDYEKPGNPPIIWKVKEVKSINGWKFQISESFSFKCNYDLPREAIHASTVINNTWVNFIFECNQINCIDFLSVSYQMLNSIQIDTTLQ